jgi:hypothetical protein
MTAMGIHGVKAPKMSCESHPLPPDFSYESDDEASGGSPRDEVRTLCIDVVTVQW